jgi:hypothetical protein
MSRRRACSVIGLEDLDRFAIDPAAKLFSRHSRRFDRSGLHCGCEYAAHVGENADADGITFDPGLRRRSGKNESE